MTMRRRLTGAISSEGLELLGNLVLPLLRIYAKSLPQLNLETRKPVKSLGGGSRKLTKSGWEQIYLRMSFAVCRTNVADNLARIETLCVCWDKLNADMSELTKALK